MRQKECILYRNFENEELLDKMTQVIEEGERELVDSALDPGSEKIREKLYDCISLLLKEAGNDYLAGLLVGHENSYSMACEIRGAVGGSINEAALHDIRIFKEYFDFDFTGIMQGFHVPELSIVLDYQPSGNESKAYNTRIRDRICTLAKQFE